MSLISRNSFIQDEDEDKNIEDYTLPTIVTSKPEVLSIKKSLAISSAMHPAVVLLIWIITVALALMGINLSLFKKPEVQLKKDIEFVLVDKEAQPRNPKTKNRSDMNSRSGGINDPKRKVSMPSPAPKKASKPSAASQRANKLIKQQQKEIKKQVKQQQTASKVQQAPAKKTTQHVPQAKPSPAKPAPPTARPSARPVSSPAPVAKPSSKFAVPAPKGAPVGKTLATGPIGGTSAPTGAKSGSSSSGGGRGSAYAPRPSLSPSSSGSGSQLSRGSSGSGNLGNPGGGGGAPGIDALREPDFGPYMRELQRRIKLNWDPPKGNESKRVVLLFKIAKDGRLLSCRVQKSSGMPSADQAALKAVELTAPFRPLPADFKGQSIDIQFTFDYNVFNASRY